jgi:hypothetical protein
MSAATLEKDQNDSRVYKFDYSRWAEFQEGFVLTGGSVTADLSGLSLGTPVVAPKINQIQIRISGGVLARKYKLTCTATTNNGDVLIQRGFLLIDSDP